MEMATEHRRRTGAYYTPDVWAKLCVKQLLEALPDPYAYVFYDPAAGEGALLDALPEGTMRIGTTLESADVTIMREKGYEAQQFDFLTMNTHFLHPLIWEASEEGRLVVLTNPPFFRLPRGRYELMKRTYPAHCGDSVPLFLLRIDRELRPVIIASWHDIGLIQSPSFSKFREEFGVMERLLCPQILTPSKTWPGVKGNFAIAFSIWAGWWTAPADYKPLKP